jgi:hypothetical protein
MKMVILNMVLIMVLRQDIVNCPVTCIAEISEYLEKTIKEIYTT